MGGGLAGYEAAWQLAERGVREDVVVDAEARGRGIGEALTREAVLREELAKAQAESLLVPAVAWGYFPVNADGEDVIVWTDDDRRTERLRCAGARVPVGAVDPAGGGHHRAVRPRPFRADGRCHRRAVE